MWMSAALRKNTPRTSSAERGAVGVKAVGMWASRTSSLFMLVLASASTRLSHWERPHKNYQVSCYTFLYFVLRKSWRGVSYLYLI
jgi:hypothetical protein